MKIFLKNSFVQEQVSNDLKLQGVANMVVKFQKFQLLFDQVTIEIFVLLWNQNIAMISIPKNKIKIHKFLDYFE